jgi:bacterioferritin (cytochrome b1)
MDVDEALRALNAALALQFRSAVRYALVAGSLTGVAFRSLAPDLGRFSTLELEDARRLVEKVTALGGDPSTDQAPLRHDADPADALAALVEEETEAIEALKAVIPHTGQEGRSEALEHRLEHMIMRKQEQVDVLLRATR